MFVDRRRRGRFLWVIVITLLITALVPTAPKALAVEDEGPWRGEYYANQTLSGTPKLVRTDLSINFDWGLDSPAPSIPNESFSARWTAFVEFQAGTYRFSTYTDDGVRLWVDGTLVLDQWHKQPAIPYDVYLTLEQGYHYIRMEYFENTDRAVAKLSWLRLGQPEQPATGWRGEYYNNIWLGGDPVLIRTDPEINFVWGHSSPASAVAADNFSVRWTRNVYFHAGTYSFYTSTDDGVRVWLDSQLIIDRWFDQSAGTHVKNVYVPEGEHNLRVEYYEHLGVATAKVWWDAGHAPTPSPPPPARSTVIIDDGGRGFKKGGLASSWYNASLGYRGHTLWTYNSVYQVFNYATWTPNLPGAGYYDVYAFIPRNYADTHSARYRVFHNGRRDDVWVAQYKYFDKWVKLGRFYFHDGGGEYVYLSDNTHEAYASNRIAFDAIKFVPVGGRAPAVPTPAPTPVPTPSYGCAVIPKAGFGRVWTNNATVRNRLGCPLQPEMSVQAAEENFQHGIMFWRSDNDRIYILYDNGIWQSVIDPWREGEPEFDPGITPPWGYYQPIRGFGEVWREEPGVRDRLGWATDQERGFTAAVQPFENGLMIWSNVEGIYVLYDDGTWQHFS